MSNPPRTILFPTDTGRSPEPLSDAHIAFTAPANIAGSNDAAMQAATLAAVLFRHTRQSPLPFDLLTATATPPDAPLEPDPEISASHTILQLAEQIRSSIVGVPDRNAETAQASNVLFSFATGTQASATQNNQPATPAQPYELQFRITDDAGQQRLTIGYRSALLTHRSAERLLQSCINAFASVAREPDINVQHLPLLSAQQQQELTDSQGRHAGELPDTPIHEIFANFARTTPQALAATSGERKLSYGDLDVLSSKLAHHLVALGVRRDTPVAVCIRPSVDILIALMAIYRAGGIYMPLDPTHPAMLINQMIDEARPAVLLTHSTLADLPVPDTLQRFNLDSDWQLISSLPSTPPAVKVQLDDGAYLIYTSGTTGKPKGVIATHGNLIFYVLAAQHRYRWAATDVFCSIARFTFSISLFDLLSPLAIGARVHLLVREEVLALDKLCATMQTVTVVHAGPSLLGSLSRHLQANATAPRSFPNIRHASSGGDLVPPSVMHDMQQIFPHAELFVIYGCTEISCMGTTYEIQRGLPVQRNMVGKPFPDVTVHVLDEELNIVPYGVVGEICFAGRGVARGYLDRAQLTAEKFLTMHGQRFYRTGDLGRLHPDGNLEILGRNDFQVQLRGMRIEPAGIENLVRSLKLAHECVAVLKQVAANDERLVAYVVAPRSDVNELRRIIATHLPDYMVPQHVIEIDALPVTTNGKVDRRRLAEMQLQLVSSTTSDASPQTAQEQTVAEVFARLLGVTHVGTDDDFFALGGHSLLAVVAMQDISTRLGVQLPPHALFESGTVRSIAAQASAGNTPAATRPILLNTAIPGPRLFMLGGVHVYRELASRLDQRCAAYGVFADHEVALYAHTLGDYSVKKLARDYVEIIRRAQPHGPYHLLGFSFTGIVAYEVTQQLHAEGETVELLALVDAVLPEWKLGWRFRVSQLTRAVSISPRLLLSYATWRVKSRLRKGQVGDDDSNRFYGINPHMRPQDRALLDPLDEVRIELNARTAGEYLQNDIRTYAGNVALIMSNERLRHDPLKSPSGGWSHYLQRYDLCNINTDHMHMLETEPYVSQTAEFILSGIQRART